MLQAQSLGDPADVRYQRARELRLVPRQVELGGGARRRRRGRGRWRLLPAVGQRHTKIDADRFAAAALPPPLLRRAVAPYALPPHEELRAREKWKGVHLRVRWKSKSTPQAERTR